MTYLGNPSPWRRIAAWIAEPFAATARAGREPRKVWVVAHRGAARFAPENTLDAFTRALELGADAIETDVCVTRDGCFVLWHDAEPSGGVALVRQAGAERRGFPWLPTLPPLGSSLRRAVVDCDEEAFFENYGYERAAEGLANPFAARRRPEVPAARLDDLLGWVGRDPRLAHVVLDLKLREDRVDDARRLFARVREASAAARPVTFHLLSTQREIVAALLEEAGRGPDGTVHVTGDFELPGVLAEARRHCLRDVSMGAGRRPWHAFRRELGVVARARRRGLFQSLLAWTLNEPDHLRDVSGLGVDGIVTDDPALLRRIAGTA